MAEPMCPLPAVQEALVPYIHTREETLRIRQRLSKYLFSLIETNDEPATHFTLANPSSSMRPKAIPSGITGVRRSYLQALQAHYEARQKLERVRSELDELKKGVSQNAANTPKKSPDHVDYIALLRLRQRHRRLEVLQNYLNLLTEEAGDSRRTNIRDVVKQELGNHPEAPAEPPRAGTESPQADELALKLKKAVLQAKYDMDQAKRNAEMQKKHASDAVDLYTRVESLRRTRDDLITWIEEQLAKVPEDSVHEDPDRKDAIPSAESQSVDMENVAERYEDYISSRASLIRSMEAPNDTPSTLLSPASPSKRAFFARHSPIPSMTSPTHAKPPQEPSQAAILLPYIATLTQTSQTSKALLAGNTFLRQELAAANEQQQATLERLVQESHLLPAGSEATVSAWTSAAANARKELETFIEDKIDGGIKSLTNGTEALKVVDEERAAMKKLKGDCI
ncbi:MAG: hypothetical protein M1820_006389 [Bogoriella megaspora]|nr:MAG: hypothetical protein M1820_006389 [Bogoriella megaspora]